jgi:hypothetical protein
LWKTWGAKAQRSPVFPAGFCVFRARKTNECGLVVAKARKLLQKRRLFAV